MSNRTPETMLAYLLDEHHRGLLWRFVQRYNLRSAFHPLNVTRVGDAPTLPLGANDPAILRWAEQEGRILISRDERTLPRHLKDHLASGHGSPGVFLTRDVALADIIDFLVCATYASEPAEWANRITFIP